MQFYDEFDSMIQSSHQLYDSCQGETYMLPRQIRSIRLREFISLSIGALILLMPVGCGVPLDDYDITEEEEPGGVPMAETERTDGKENSDDYFMDSFANHKHATISTDFDTYDVRGVSFSSGLGFGSSGALAGYYLNTKLDLAFKYISEVRIIDQITMSDALSVPHRFDMVEEQDLNYIFRTELKRTNGEWIEYIVRINRIGGSLQEGGGFNLHGDELQTLKRIVFF